VRYALDVDDLTIRPGFFANLLRAVGLVKVSSDGKVEHDAGADFVEDMGFRSGYDPKAAMSALAAFPWPFSCVQAISTDLSSVPLRAYRGRGASAEVLDSHPVVELMEKPSSRVNGVLFRRQIYSDLVLTGNAFVLLAGQGSRVDALLRLHPSRVQISPLSDGQPDQYQYHFGGGEPANYEHDVVLHVRGPSWSDDPTNLWGTGAVQPLHNDLTTEKAQAALAARTASTGQPTGILSPREEGDRWSRDQIKTLREAYELQMKAGGSGVLILGGQAQFDKLQITPREMEFSQVRDFVRASTIAAFGCVPVRLGLETANYSQSRNQLQLYWESLRGRAALVDAELTRLARIMGDEDVTIRHDFSEIESLQESRTDRVNRVTTWSMLGLSTAEAAAYEGFDDLPIQVDDEIDDELELNPGDDEPSNEPPAGEPLAATALNGAQIASLMQILASVAAGAISFDSALVLIGVAFPTIDEQSARAILSGAQAVDDDENQLEQLSKLAKPTRRSKYDEIDFSVPKGVRSELERGLEWHEQGLSGDGLVPATVSWARRMANGEDISPEKAVKMRAWLARHESDKSGEGFSPGEDGFPSPGRVAWALWGGDPALSWSAKLVRQMRQADEDAKKTVSREVDSEVWKRYVRQVQEPAEKAIQLSVLRYLKGQAARIARRLPSVIGQKAVNGSIVIRAEGDDWIDDLIDGMQERRIANDELRGAFSDAWKSGVEAALDDMPADLSGAGSFNYDEVNKQVDEQLASLLGINAEGKITDTGITDTTRQQVRDLVVQELAEGESMNAIQAKLMASQSFDAVRALKIARTESTRSVSAGGINAWEQQAERAGVEVDFVWRSQPGAREAHADLNGVERGEDGVWTIGEAEASHPGGFGVASLDINCRCFYEPKVKR
tara:strand:+ start:1434 stop:4130 length:2697 start_codon:yes stop_codon:yes gene_type:complete